MSAAVPPVPEVRVDRTAHQVCTPDGEPYPGYLTSSIWVTKGDAYTKTDGNAVTPILSGKEYYEALADGIAGARTSIYILGWQINWDVMLKPGWRLYDALLSAAKSNSALRIYVLPWDDSMPVDTFDDQTVEVITQINSQLIGKERAFAILAVEHPSSSVGFDMSFSHHQKQVVIDDDVAFMGGIDIAYGRRDDATFPLNAAGRLGNDAYNGCVPHLLKVNPADYVDGHLVNAPSETESSRGTQVNRFVTLAKSNLASGRVERPAGYVVLDAARQPRMPWQDAHLKIEGPAVSDLASNFVMRWNVAKKEAELRLPAAPKSYRNRGSCSVQMLRSASHVMVDLEAKYLNSADRTRVHEKFGHNHIYHAWVQLIEHAEHFIYIENQFFVSAFGPERFGDLATSAPARSAEVSSVTTAGLKASKAMRGSSTLPPSNRICEALGAKLQDVIMDLGNPSPDGKNSPFHVYITIPVHSEGSLADPSVMSQVHYTMQTLVYGAQSLVNRIRRAIKARQLVDGKVEDHTRVFRDDNDEYKQIPIERCWPYLTLLNLRNWDKLSDHFVTEQVYIHTKLIVVDDRYAIVGSANVNDRSQLGDRDSELAVLVVDNDVALEDVGAAEGATVVRGFARKLRVGLWNKILGNTGGVRPAGLAGAISRPAVRESWEAIRATASNNSTIYSSVFPHIPANGRSIWPTITMENGKRLTGLMPFDADFWANPRAVARAAPTLNEVKGYVTLLPWTWTMGQNNKADMHSALFTKYEPPAHDAASSANGVATASVPKAEESSV